MQLPSSLLENAVAQFAKLPGIGKKTAERLVLELRDKVNKIDSIVHAPASPSSGFQQDALNALVALGITRAQGETAIKKIAATEPNILNLEELIKKALKAI